MNQLDLFIDRVLSAAKAAGIDPAEVRCSESSDFSAEAMEGSIDSYEVSNTRSLSLRGVYNGRMGGASTEVFDEDAIAMLVRGVQESASLVESKEQDEIFPGEKEYPSLEIPQNDLDTVSAEEKLAFCLEMEKAATAIDPRVSKSMGAYVSTSVGASRLANSYGLRLSRQVPPGGMAMAGVYLMGRDGESTATDGEMKTGRQFHAFDPVEIGRSAAENTLARLNASPVSTGVYRTVLRWDAMRSLLATFAGIFSAESAQQKLSLLAGREGEVIAAPCVTLIDDPLLPGGVASTPYDAEGSAARTKAVIEDGTLRTLLHNRKTARKQGVETTGNASGGATGPVHVSPTNLFLKPGVKSLPELLEQLDDGLLITELSGLHAGANPISGDFSLIAKGFLVVNGRQDRPVEQITVAGNFYQLLKDIRDVGADLEFRGRAIGCPSVDVGTLPVSGAK